MHHLNIYLEKWGERRGLNPRHPGPQPGALPAELRPPRVLSLNRTGIIYIHKKRALPSTFTHVDY